MQVGEEARAACGMTSSSSAPVRWHRGWMHFQFDELWPRCKVVIGHKSPAIYPIYVFLHYLERFQQYLNPEKSVILLEVSVCSVWSSASRGLCGEREWGGKVVHVTKHNGGLPPVLMFSSAVVVVSQQRQQLPWCHVTLQLHYMTRPPEADITSCAFICIFCDSAPWDNGDCCGIWHGVLTKFVLQPGIFGHWWSPVDVS